MAICQQIEASSLGSQANPNPRNPARLCELKTHGCQGILIDSGSSPTHSQSYGADGVCLSEARRPPHTESKDHHSKCQMAINIGTASTPTHDAHRRESKRPLHTHCTSFSHTHSNAPATIRRHRERDTHLPLPAVNRQAHTT
mmetsp:Transcript_34826/g.100261  ORF Transcript_34826/g.100261 Transcript_34826/m.100261 type:complete len:142 (-) Transcript_34826:223-648(-)